MNFKKQKCQFCHSEISTGGAASTSHMRSHVRKKEAEEHKIDGKLLFVKPGTKIEIKTKIETEIKNHYETINCQVCNEQISAGGAAFTSHMRSHVRRGEAVEFKRNGKLLFLKNGVSIIDIEPFAKLGFDQLPGQPKDVWELPNIKTEMPMIDPSAYFITSGEAVKKAEKLEKDLFALAIKARFLLRKLRKARGLRKYLELARDDNRLLVKAKDPRVKIEDEIIK
jgi:hypothetical protein